MGTSCLFASSWTSSLRNIYLSAKSSHAYLSTSTFIVPLHSCTIWPHPAHPMDPGYGIQSYVTASHANDLTPPDEGNWFRPQPELNTSGPRRFTHPQLHSADGQRQLERLHRHLLEVSEHAVEASPPAPITSSARVGPHRYRYWLTRPHPQRI